MSSHDDEEPDPLAFRARFWFDKASELQSRCDKQAERIQQLKDAIVVLSGMEAPDAISALSWINRAETAEGLLEELMGQVRAREREHFPAGWLSRTEAILAAVRLLSGDQRQRDSNWQTKVDEEGRRVVQRQRPDA